jgi:4-aminobutyrate aminotransferase
MSCVKRTSLQTFTPGIYFSDPLVERIRLLTDVSCSSPELFAFLNNLKDDPAVGSHIVDVRGRGLMVGVEFSEKGMASKVANKCIEKGMLILTTSVYEVIRFIPPLNLTKEELEEGCNIFAKSVHEVVEA